jgi:sugar lactone lactonase YvrE
VSDIVQQSSDLEAIPASEKKVKSKRGRRLLVTALILLIILLLITSVFLVQLMRPKGAPSQTDLEGVTWIRSIYGFGPDTDQFTNPASAAIDPSGGTFWLSDQGRFRMIRFDENARFLALFDGDRENGDSFDYPSRIAVAPDGWRYVAQSSYNNVKVYDDEGTLQQTLDVPNPAAVAVNDEMAVIGAQSGFVAFDREGQVIGFVGERGYEEDQFDTVNGVVLDDDSNVYIVDSFNNRISKYDREGDRLWLVETGAPANRAGSNMGGGSSEAAQEQYPAMMQLPMGATIDGAGRLIVIDMLDFSIAAFTTEDGTFLGKWGTFGREDGRFAYPADIDYDSTLDWFIVSDSGNERAQIIRLPGSGGTAQAAARRLLAGPLRACFFPLILVVIMVISWFVLRNRKKKRELMVVEEIEGADALTE